MGWQEVVIVLFIFIITLVPSAIVWRGSRRRTGKVSVGWVIATVFFGWVGMMLWIAMGRKTPKGDPSIAWSGRSS
jgi:NADH:ubiquinone oxidoreductase subunit 6 (subunit J)